MSCLLGRKLYVLKWKSIFTKCNDRYYGRSTDKIMLRSCSDHILRNRIWVYIDLVCCYEQSMNIVASTLMFQSLEAGNSLTLSYIIFVTTSLASGVQPTYYKIVVVGAYNVYRKIVFLHWVFYFPLFNEFISWGFVVYFLNCIPT